MLFVSGLDKGLVIGTLIAGATMFILTMMSIIVFMAIICLKQKQEMPQPMTNGLQQHEMMKESDLVTLHQLQSGDYEILSDSDSELKSNSADAQLAMNETEENVAYHFTPIKNKDYYSNDSEYDYEEI